MAGAAEAPSALPTTDQVARYTIVMGYNGGAPDPRPPLSYADDDAARLYLLLASSSERAYLLTTFDRASARGYPDLVDVSRQPTREALAQVLGEVSWLIRAKKRAGVRTELVFAFAGHGDVDDGGEGYLVFADGPFKRTDLDVQLIEPSPADVNHVFIDACSSYFMVQARGGGDEARSGAVPLSSAMLDVMRGGASAAARARTGAIVATSGAAEVHESAELEGGVFSFLLRSALAGAADTGGDGRIEYAEAAGFIASASANLDDPRARVSIHVSAPLTSPHVALTDFVSTPARQFLRVDEPGPVHLRLLDARGVPWVEVNRAAGPRPLVVALAGSPFYVVQSRGREAVLVPRAAGAYSFASLAFDEPVRARGATLAVLGSSTVGSTVGASGTTTVSHGDGGLFARPYGEDVLEGFLASSDLTPPRSGSLFSPAFAPAGEPPARLPVGAIALWGGAAAVALGAGAVAAVGVNQAAFVELQQGFERTGSLDADVTETVEASRAAATALTLTAGALAVGSGALFLWSTQLDEGDLVLRW